MRWMRKLKENGFTDGGATARGKTRGGRMGQWLGAEALFYTTLVDFGYVNVGFYAQRKVTVMARLVDAKTGERLWGGGGG